jgi:hypothetical protein
MAVTIVGVSPSAVWPGAGGPFSPSLPAGTTTGDVFVVPIIARDASATIDLITGYTLLTTDNLTDAINITGEVQAKVAGVAEGAPSVHSSIANTQPTGAVVLALRGAAAIGTWTVPAPNVGASGTVPAPDAVATVAGTMVLRVYLNSDDNTITTPPAGHTQVFYESTLQGSDANMAVFVANATLGAGASAGVANLVYNGNDAYIAATILVPPAASGTDVADRGLGVGPHGAATTVVRSAGNATGGADTTGPHGAAASPATSQGSGATRAMSVGGSAGVSPAQSVSAGLTRALGVGSVGPMGSPAKSDFGVQDRALGIGSVGPFASPARSVAFVVTRALGDGGMGWGSGLAASIAGQPVGEPLPVDAYVSPWVYGYDVVVLDDGVVVVV